MNNVDLAIQKLRQLQQMMYDTNVSTNELNKFLEQEVFMAMQRASKEIEANYKDISEKLTAQLNTGKPQE